MRQAHIGIGTSFFRDLKKMLTVSVLLGIFASLAVVVPVFASQPHLLYFPLPTKPWSPSTGILLHSMATRGTKVMLNTFDERGNLLSQIPTSLGPSESKTFFPGADREQLPEGTAAVVVESDKAIAGFTVFGSLEAPLEVLPASGALSQTLEFPYFSQDNSSWTTYFLFNPDTSAVAVTFQVFDKDGGLLAEVPISPLSSRETRATAVERLLDKSLLPFVETVRAVADAPLSGVEVIEQGKDVAAFSGLSSPSTQLSVPIVTSTEQGIKLGTTVRLFNSGSAPASLSVEAFDVSGNSLGTLPEISSLAPMASVLLETRNVGSSLPKGTAFLNVSSDQSIAGYAFLRAIYGDGLAIIPGLAEFALVGSDSNILVVLPALAAGASEVEQTFRGLRADYWRKSISWFQKAAVSNVKHWSTNQPTSQISSTIGSDTAIPVLQWPLNGRPSDRRILLGFGRNWTWDYCGGIPKKHVAVDISATPGEEVYASAKGEVRAIFNVSSKHNWGKAITIEHAGFTTTYHHVIPLVSGGTVTQGQKIAIIADISDASDHLHYGIRRSSYSNISNRGALPQKNTTESSSCRNDPVFPGNFIDPLTLAYGSNNAQLAASTSSITTTPGGSINFSITAKNTGASTWSETTLYRLGWLSGFSGFGNVPSDKRYKLTAGESIAPNASRTWNINVMAPTTPGTYPIVFQMVQDNVQWFGNTITINVSVQGCTSSLSPSGQTFGSAGGTGSVNVSTPGGCNWTAVSGASWIMITSGSSGSGNGQVNYTVESNSSTSSRTGTLTIAGKTFTVTQTGRSVPPPPQITSINPAQIAAGTFDLTINGSNFDDGAVDQIFWAADGHFVGQGTVLGRSSSQLVVREFMTGATSGTYIVRVRNSDGQLSNGINLVVVSQPTLSIDGGTSSTRPRGQGQAFSFTGSNYTPNRTVTRYLLQPNGSTIILTPTLSANSSGNVSWTYTPSCTAPTGTYTAWAVDDATGKRSNNVTEIITQGPGC